MSQSADRRPMPDTRNAGAEYWKAAAAGRLVLPSCRGCAKPFWYPRRSCPRCGTEEIEWMTAHGTGRVHTFTVVRQSGDPFFRARVPFVVAMIELEEGPLLLSNVIDCDAASIAIGMRVEACFEAAPDGIAIPLFRPARTADAS